MKKILFTNVFSDTKKSLNLKGYILTLFFSMIFLFLPNYFVNTADTNTADIEITKIIIIFWSVLFSMICAWIFIFKRKIAFNKENILRFIINNILFTGALYIYNFLITLSNSGFFEKNFIFLIIYSFITKITSIFIFFTAVSGIFTLIGKEKISFIESGKIFKNSFGKFFTILFFWLFYELYNYEYINTIFLISYSARYGYYIDRLIISKIIEILFDNYIFYFFLAFVSNVFKSYLKKSESEEIYEDKNSVFFAFENTIGSLKGRKFKFFGMISGIYFLCGITITAVSCLLVAIMPRSTLTYYSSILTILTAAIIIYGVMTFFKIFITKKCFKFLGKSTEKIDFSNFMKIYGYGVIIDILAIIVEGILIFLPALLLENNYRLPTLRYGVIYFIAFYFIVVHYMITAFILTGQKGNIKKSFKESLKFFSWKFIPIILGIYKLNGIVLEILETMQDTYFFQFSSKYFATVLCDMTIFFIVFAFSNIIVLAVVNYSLPKEEGVFLEF